MEIDKIYNEDCLVGMDKVDEKSVDLILTDLPYGTTACKWDSIIPLDKLWRQYERIIKDDGVIVLFGQEPFSSMVRMSNIEMYRYDWIWVKQKPSNFQLMNYQCGRVQENIMVFSKMRACYTPNGNSIRYYPQMEKRAKPRTANVKIYGDNKLTILHDYNTEDNIKTYEYKMSTSLLHFNTVSKKSHPTEKPVPLLEYLIKTYTKDGELVLDSCFGSGSTMVACVNTDRHYIGFEKEKEYYRLADNRIDATVKNKESNLKLDI